MIENSIQLTREEAKTLYARKFSMWLGVGALSMMFAGFTSAYIVKKADTELWNQFVIPSEFMYSTIAIVLSSIAFIWAANAIKKKDDSKQYLIRLSIALILGITFCVLQFQGWKALIESGVFLRDDVSGAFFYIITGSHFLHVIGGIIAIIYTLIRLIRKRRAGIYDVTVGIHPTIKNRVELLGIYWHFVDILWLYLYFFLVFNHQ